ncbi:hypothetical protein AB0P45_36220 [Streptomyces niveus]|uniref:hypothetical protein n=1 Tax=Streptomyces niveus TaxID=193462 RepID=UPI00343151AD
MMRFLEIRRTRTPRPADFDHDFPALIARTLSDLTPDERHVLRSVALLDAFDLSLATAAAGLQHQAPALRLIERPFVRENAFGLWPYHLARADPLHRPRRRRPDGRPLVRTRLGAGRPPDAGRPR